MYLDNWNMKRFLKINKKSVKKTIGFNNKSIVFFFLRWNKIGNFFLCFKYISLENSKCVHWNVESLTKIYIGIIWSDTFFVTRNTFLSKLLYVRNCYKWRLILMKICYKIDNFFYTLFVTVHVYYKVGVNYSCFYVTYIYLTLSNCAIIFISL